ncbi:MAG: methylmalonyl Co-A mutase-associated GTPase MeaB [candidate division KSB1 bacterium]|jgi:LAO/AO transport system kinase|nr:methylmalonyl Co-A mutase-associated GTPase MeaB [candidate division KSB1 bacterium]
MEDLLKRYLSGDRRALARLISIVEDDSDDALRLLDRIYHRVGRAYRIGITGPPGAGKSTLVDQMAKTFRLQDARVGVIAVDPTSPFTGGALLGDRIRMNELSTDRGVFIRSMATRGSLGGLAHRAQEVADLLDAFGFDIILIETVGVGQSELDIVEAADSTVVVLVPESGDSIQAMKAGLMEIADIFVLNKSDREGAERILLELKSVLGLDQRDKPWQVPIVQTIANTGDGLPELMQQIENHRTYQKNAELLTIKKKQRIESYVRQIIDDKLTGDFWNEQRIDMLNKEIDKIYDKIRSPYSASIDLFESFDKSASIDTRIHE